MSNPVSSRKGSALLIVLGFLSFMVVSAVAFSVFMRAERAPSSLLRRSVVTRHLVKAALAEAISHVDDAVRNDVFPGQAGSGNNGVFYRDRKNNAMDVWQGRVFMPPDLDGSTQPGDDKTRFAPINETVSVLNLEGLGYLPPPLVNDVRFLARCSWSSKWQNFPFDAGRYAYVAVNVSDYFDINKLRANKGRTSEDNGRIALASVFKDTSGTKIDSNAAKGFDDFVHDSRVTGNDGARSTTPYVSMLDYNLALGDKFREAGFGSGYNSPFWTWINKPSQSVFYQTLATNEGSKISFAKRQTFVTDSWFPIAAGSTGDEKTNLLYEAAQPFKTATMDKGADAQAIQVIGESTDFKTLMQTTRNYLNLSDWPSLFDYLDRDDLPMSVALPCTERVPMTAALEPALDYQIKCRVEKSVATDPASPLPGQGYKQITTYSVKLEPQHFPSVAALRAVFAFPFKRGKDLNSGNSFKAQAMMRLFLVASKDANQQLGLRSTGSTFANLRPKSSEWGSAKAFELARGGRAAVVTYLSKERTLSYPSDVQDEEDAFMDNGLTTFSDLTPQGLDSVILFQRTETVQMSSSGAAQGAPEVAWSFPNDVRPIAVDGSLMPDLKGDEYASYVIRPYLATWVKVENNDGVVDYVPAMLDDDQELGGVNNAQLASLGDSRINVGDSAGTPLLRMMDDSVPVPLGSLYAAAVAGGADFTAPNKANWSPKSYFTVDPRYNWAPEDWLPKSKSASKDQWLDSLTMLGQNGCDPDIFMGFSNQGYLQSMGEIAMLPKLTDDSGATIPISFNGAVRQVDCDWTSIAHANTAWKTYPIDYELSEDERKTVGNALFNMGIICDGSGFRVNPYTDSLQVMRAALDCTPYDWWAAGTNTVTKGAAANSRSASLKQQILKDASKAVDYAFCDDCQEAKLSPKDVEWLASYLMGQFQANPTKSWEEVFDSLDWYANADNQDKLFGHQLENNLVLHNVDRKYLYSYWRGCFANKQQLYLIFVRAESNALGGPGEGTPAQQGGRAVALVWRDPKLEGNAQDWQDNNQSYAPLRHPHRTRILFYHQFE